MRQVDFIIVGQGLAGTFCSFYLHKANKSFIVIDELNERSASRVSSGILNPVTGRKYVKTWMIDALMPFAEKAYTDIEQLLKKKYFFQKPIHKYFANNEATQYFNERANNESSAFLEVLDNEELLHDYLNNINAAIKISPTFFLDSKNLIQDFGQWLQVKNNLLNESFQHNSLIISETCVRYKNIEATQIIFCEGHKIKHNPWFNHIPVSANKGDFLLVKIPLLPAENMINHSVFLVPLYDDVFWAGSNYQHKFESEEPLQNNRLELEEKLKQTLKVPYEILKHSCGIRPTILNRRPVLGTHPTIKQLAVFNGLGTKGISLAPYFAKQLISYLLYKDAVDAEVSVARFEK